MAGRKRTPTRTREVVLQDGTRVPIVGENARYWLCEGTQFRKRGGQVVRVEDVVLTTDPSVAALAADAGTQEAEGGGEDADQR